MRQLFAKLGKLISSAGSQRFAAEVHELLAESVQFEVLVICEWTLDEAAHEIVMVRPVGISGMKVPGRFRTANATFFPDGAGHPLPTRVLMAPDGMQLLQLYGAPFGGLSSHSASSMKDESCFQCHLISRHSNYRYVTSLYREPRQNDFSLQEMLILGSFSNVLLPLVESHATTLSSAAHDNQDGTQATANAAATPELLRAEFERRLKRADCRLSKREIEVCLGMLFGQTAQEIADALGIKKSSIATYVKRAAIKLGFGGHRGLVKWMMDDYHSNTAA